MGRPFFIRKWAKFFAVCNWLCTGVKMSENMDQKSAGTNIRIFFCQQIDVEQDVNRRVIEKEFGSRVVFFPLPCSGRIEPLHLLRALESGGDKVYLVTCPDGACRFREGNFRARKRLAFAQGLIEEIGFKRERLELISLPAGTKTTIDKLARELIAREE
jgi:F420-non-reducing hydrogenase iron-sulfur subunit